MIFRRDVVPLVDVVVATAGSASDVVVMVGCPCDEDGMFWVAALGCCVVRGSEGRDELADGFFFVA